MYAAACWDSGCSSSTAISRLPRAGSPRNRMRIARTRSCRRPSLSASSRVSGSSGSQVMVDCGSNNTIVGNYIGVNSGGTSALPGRYGVILVCSFGAGNRVGGPAQGERNVIAVAFDPACPRATSARRSCATSSDGRIRTGHCCAQVPHIVHAQTSCGATASSKNSPAVPLPPALRSPRILPRIRSGESRVPVV